MEALIGLHVLLKRHGVQSFFYCGVSSFQRGGGQVSGVCFGFCGGGQTRMKTEEKIIQVVMKHSRL